MSINDYPQGGFNALMRERAIDMAVKRAIACPGLTLKESAEVIIRHSIIAPELIRDKVNEEFRKIMVE